MKFLNDIFTKRADPQTVMMLHYTVLSLSLAVLLIYHVCMLAQAVRSPSTVLFLHMHTATERRLQQHRPIMPYYRTTPRPKIHLFQENFFEWCSAGFSSTSSLHTTDPNACCCSSAPSDYPSSWSKWLQFSPTHKIHVIHYFGKAVTQLVNIFHAF